MINNKLLKSKRLEMKLSQVEVGQLTQKRFKCGSQQGYRKLEAGEAKSSKYLPYYCKVLELELSEVDSAMSESITNDKEKAIQALRSLSEADQVNIALEILKKVHKTEG